MNLDSFSSLRNLLITGMYPKRKATRMAGFDYSTDNLYFVTSCVRNRVCCFGKVARGQMNVNVYGAIAEQQWRWLGERYPYVVLHAFVVMPNHIHGIIEINASMVNDAGTGRDLSVHGESIKIKSLSELMGAYKTTVSKKIHLAGYPEFAWHRSFHDHIIRDARAFQNIKAYIENNPVNWKGDAFYDF